MGFKSKRQPREAEYVSVQEAAEILAISRYTVYNLIERGEIPCIRVGALRRIPKTFLESYKTEKKEV